MQQISLFDFDEEVIKKDIYLEENKSKVVNMQQHSNIYSLNSLDIKMLETYKGEATRIIKTCSGRYAIEMHNKIKYYDSKGIYDYDICKKLNILAIDTILYSSNDFEINDTQKRILKDYINCNQNVISKVIKRYGDENYIVILNSGTSIGINANGWLLDFASEVKYNLEDVLDFQELESVEVVESEINEDSEVDFNNTDSYEFIEENPISREYSLEEEVAIKYFNDEYVGVVKRIYNNGDTLNIEFNGMRTAFHISTVRKISI